MHTAVMILALSFLSPQQDPTVPAGAVPVTAALGIGVQIYECGSTNGTLAWTLQGPDAKLFDPATQQQVGTHSAGPVWTWKDESSVRGKVLQKLASPNAGSIPWLLLTAEPAGGGAGVLSQVKFVRRSETQGGNAPSDGCDATQLGTTLRVPYTARYTFYGAAQK